MQNYSIPRHIWRAIYPLIIFLLASFLASFIVGFVYMFSLGAESAVSSEAFSDASFIEDMSAYIIENTTLMLLISSSMLIILFALMWRKIRTGMVQYENSGLSALLFILVLLFCAAANYITVSFLMLTDIFKYFPSYEQVAEAITSGDFIIRILAVGIVGPLAEELCFRGIIFNRLSSWMPVWVAVIISSALFAIAHLNLLQGLYAFVIGVMFCLLYVRYRNLWIPIIGHMAYNSAGVIQDEILMQLGVEHINAWLFLIPSLLVAGICITLMVKFTKAAKPVQEPISEPIQEPIME